MLFVILLYAFGCKEQKFFSNWIRQGKENVVAHAIKDGALFRHCQIQEFMFLFISGFCLPLRACVPGRLPLHDGVWQVKICITFTAIYPSIRSFLSPLVPMEAPELSLIEPITVAGGGNRLTAQVCAVATHEIGGL